MMAAPGTSQPSSFAASYQEQALIQAQEAARLAVHQLIQTGSRSKVNKDKCREVVQAGEVTLRQLQMAVQSGNSDASLLLLAASRLHAAANRARSKLEKLGRPSKLGRIFQSRAERSKRLSLEVDAFSQVFSAPAALTSPMLGLTGPLMLQPGGGSLLQASQSAMVLPSVPPSLQTSLASPPELQQHAQSAPIAGSMRSHASYGGGPKHPGHAFPGVATPMISELAAYMGGAPGQMSGSTFDTASMQSSAWGTTAGGLGMGMGSSLSQALMGGVGGGSYAGRAFSGTPALAPGLVPRTLRASDNKPVAHLCFLPGSDEPMGDGPPTQLMVVVGKQVELYSAALDGFCSNLAMDSKDKELSASALDASGCVLATGHVGGTVRLHGRAPLAPGGLSGGGDDIGSAAGAPYGGGGSGAKQPLVVRIGNKPITSVCVTGYWELRAAGQERVMAGQVVPTNLSTGGAPAAQGKSATGDVLLFAGDAAGQVMAVRCRWDPPDARGAVAFTAVQRTVSGRSLGPRVGSGDVSAVQEMLFRQGYLFAATSGMHLYCVKLRDTSDLAGLSGSNAQQQGASERPFGELSLNPGQRGGAGAAASLPGRSPAVSAGGSLPAGTGTPGSLSLHPPAAPFAAGSDGPATPAMPRAGHNANSNEVTVRRGSFALSTVVTDSSSFIEYGQCMALHALDWAQPPQGATDSSGRALSAPLSGDGSGNGGGAGGGGALYDGGVAGGGLSGMRLLSAHAGGQVVLWDVAGARLQPVCAIGDPGQAIVSLSCYPHLGLMLGVLASGALRAGPLPSSALTLPHSPLGGVPVWRMRQALIKVHKGRITTAATLGRTLATGSKAGGVKVWDVLQLYREAVRQGVAFLTPAGVATAASASLQAPFLPSGIDDDGLGQGMGGGGGPYASPFGAVQAQQVAMMSVGAQSGNAYPTIGPQQEEGSGAPQQQRRHHHHGGHGMHRAGSDPMSVASDLPPGMADTMFSGNTNAMFAAGANALGGGAAPPGARLSHGGLPRIAAAGADAEWEAARSAATARRAATGPLQSFTSNPDGVDTGLGLGMSAPGDGAPPPSPGRYNGNTGDRTSASPLETAAVAVTAAVHWHRNTTKRSFLHQQLQTALESAQQARLQAEQKEKDEAEHQKLVTGGDGDLAVAASAPSATGDQGPPPSPPLGKTSRPHSGLLPLSEPSVMPHPPPAPAPVAAPQPQPHPAPHSQTRDVLLGAIMAQQASAQHALDERGSGNTFSTSGGGAHPVGVPAASPRSFTGANAAGAAAAASAAQSAPKAKWLAGGVAMSLASDNRQQHAHTHDSNRFPSPTHAAAQQQQHHHHQGQGQGQQHDARYPNMPASAASPWQVPSGGGMPPAMGLGPAGFGMPHANTSGAGAVMAWQQHAAAAQSYGAPLAPPAAEYPPLYGSGPSSLGFGASPAQHVPGPQAAMPSQYGLGPPPGMPPQYGLGPPPPLYGGMPPYGSPTPNRPATPMSQHSGYGGFGLGGGGVYGAAGYGGSGYGGYHNGHRNSMDQSDFDQLSRRTSFSGYDFPLGTTPSEAAMLHMHGLTRRMSSSNTMPHPELMVYPPAANHGGPAADQPPVQAATAAHAPAAQQQQQAGMDFINPLLQNCFIRPSDLRLIEPIGQGAEGTVWRGRWHHIDVACKEIHPKSASFTRIVSIARDLTQAMDANGTSTVLQGLIKEVSALMDLGQHPNIIRFVGVCVDPPRIVTEYYKAGSLFQLLKEARQGNMRVKERFSWVKRLVMLQDIAAGMAYLHSRNYIHGDLRSPNVFVTEDQHLKIGDFGFARILGSAEDGDVGVKLTNPRWQAPEVYNETHPAPTKAADVYSFGIIMYEMLTFKQPYDDVADDGVVMCRHTLNPSWRPGLPADDASLPVPTNVHLHAYKHLMDDCWNVDAAKRPAFHKVAERLMALVRWHKTLSQVRRTLPMTRKMHAGSMPRMSSATAAAAAAATAAAAAGSGSGPHASLSDHDHDGPSSGELVESVSASVAAGRAAMYPTRSGSVGGQLSAAVQQQLVAAQQQQAAAAAGAAAALESRSSAPAAIKDEDVAVDGGQGSGARQEEAVAVAGAAAAPGAAPLRSSLRSAGSGGNGARKSPLGPGATADAPAQPQPQLAYGELDHGPFGGQSAALAAAALAAAGCSGAISPAPSGGGYPLLHQNPLASLEQPPSLNPNGLPGTNSQVLAGASPETRAWYQSQGQPSSGAATSRSPGRSSNGNSRGAGAAAAAGLPMASSTTSLAGGIAALEPPAGEANSGGGSSASSWAFGPPPANATGGLVVSRPDGLRSSPLGRLSDGTPATPDTPLLGSGGADHDPGAADPQRRSGPGGADAGAGSSGAAPPDEPGSGGGRRNGSGGMHVSFALPPQGQGQAQPPAAAAAVAAAASPVRLGPSTDPYTLKSAFSSQFSLDDEEDAHGGNSAAQARVPAPARAPAPAAAPRAAAVAPAPARGVQPPPSSPFMAMAAAARAAGAGYRKPQQQQAAPKPLGGSASLLGPTAADPYSLNSPFLALHGVSNLDDSDNEDGMGDTVEASFGPGAMPMAAAPAVPPPQAAAAAAKASSATQARSAAQAPQAVQTPPPRAAAPSIAPPPANDPFALNSPFHAMGNLDDDSDNEERAGQPERRSPNPPAKQLNVHSLQAMQHHQQQRASAAAAAGNSLANMPPHMLTARGPKTPPATPYAQSTSTTPTATPGMRTSGGGMVPSISGSSDVSVTMDGLGEALLGPQHGGLPQIAEEALGGAPSVAPPQ